MKAIVIGASIGGLATALALERLGLEVQLLERGRGPMHGRGAGLGIDLGVMEALVGKTAAEKMPRLRLEGRALHQGPDWSGRRERDFTSCLESGGSVVSTWDDLYTTLLSELTSPIGYGVSASGMVCGDSPVVIDQDQERHAGDLIVGADGHNSIARSAVNTSPSPEYSGYFLWRGFLEADQPSEEAAAFFLDGRLHIFAKKPFHLVVYEVPGLSPDRRRLNWGWYAAVSDLERAAILVRSEINERAMVIESNRLSSEDAENWSARAEAIWPESFSRLIQETVAARRMFGNAIYEWAGSPIVGGAVALVGDAAHLMSPITGAGARFALRDALILAGALRSVGTANSLSQALRIYESSTVRAAAANVVVARSWALEALAAHPVMSKLEVTTLRRPKILDRTSPRGDQEHG
jgi:2-polyprenyl-6-methoxyphenol hydroxylase-like FAD-dependent oxidoreductase